MKDETLDYLEKINGGNWSTDEKKKKLYDLVIKASEEFPDTTPLSCEIGVFGGVSLFCMATAHKYLKKGFAIGIDSWDNITPLEGTNHPDNNKWWKALDIKSVFNAFVKDTEREDWSGYVKYLKGRSDAFAGEFADESITVFHQDGNHNIECITKELELWSPKVKTGGYWVADDTNWVEAKDGYAKLPSFGFELVEDFTTWQIWKKVGVKKVEPEKKKPGRKKKVSDAVIESPTTTPPKEEVVQVSSDSPPEGSFAWMVLQGQKKETKEVAFPEVVKPEIRNAIFEKRKINHEKDDSQRGMQIGNYNIKPIALYLSDEQKWLDQKLHAEKYFAEQGVEDIYWLNGVHARSFGIKGTHIYLLDNKPEEKFYVGDANVGNFISQYMAYNVMDALAENTDITHFAYFEGDCEFVEGWKEKLALALEDIPADFDMLYAGSCCCQGKQGVLVSKRSGLHHYPNRGGENFWHYFPLCTHFYIISAKAVKHMIKTQRDCANPTDISIARYALGDLKTYAILPRLAGQFKTELHP